MKGLPRWLCSMTPTPEPSRFHRAAWLRSMTDSGRTAGPAEKLKMRSLMVGFLVRGSGGSGGRDGRQIDAEDLGHRADRGEVSVVGRRVELDACAGRCG